MIINAVSAVISRVTRGRRAEWCTPEEMVDRCDLIQEATNGHRASLIEQGFPDEMANHLAANLCLRLQAVHFPVDE